MLDTLKRPVRLVALGLAAFSIPVAANALTGQAGGTQSAGTEPSVLVFDQKLAGGQVNIDYVYAPQKGHIVVYGSDQAGKPSDKPLGTASVPAGSNNNIKVKISEAPQAGQRLWVSLYADGNGNSNFDRGADKSLWPAGSLPAENAFVVR